MRCSCGAPAVIFRGCPCEWLRALCGKCVTPAALRELKASHDDHALDCARATEKPFDPWWFAPLHPKRAAPARAVAVLEAKRPTRALVANVLRTAIMGELGKGELQASVLASRVKCAPPVLSYHLDILRAAGFVTVRRDGRFCVYSVEQDDAA